MPTQMTGQTNKFVRYKGLCVFFATYLVSCVCVSHCGLKSSARKPKNYSTHIAEKMPIKSTRTRWAVSKTIIICAMCVDECFKHQDIITLKQKHFQQYVMERFGASHVCVCPWRGKFNGIASRKRIIEESQPHDQHQQQQKNRHRPFSQQSLRTEKEVER